MSDELPLAWVRDKNTGDRWLLPEVSIDEVEEELNGVGGAKLSFDPLGENATQIKLGERELELWEGSDQIFAGPMNDIAGNSRRLTLQADGLWDYIKYRFVLQDNLIYEDTEQLTIAANLITYAQSAAQGNNPDLRITLAGFAASGILRTREYISERKHNLFEALAEFSTLEEGFDQAIMLQPNGTRVWTPFFPFRGEVKDVPLEYGREIIDYNYKESYRKRATKIAATGGVAEQVDGERLKQEFTFEDTVASDRYGVSVGVLPSGSRSDLPWLEARARSAVARRKAPLRVPEITIDNSKTPVRHIYSVGDWAPVRIDHGRVQIAGVYRIQKKVWLPSANQVKFTFLEPEE